VVGSNSTFETPPRKKSLPFGEVGSTGSDGLLKASVKLERYRDWANYQLLRTYNVEAAYHNLLTYH